MDKVRNRLLRATAALENAKIDYAVVGGNAVATWVGQVDQAAVRFALDGPDAKARDAVHVVFAGEKVKQDYALPAPDVTESAPSESFRVLQLEALVRMKLTSFRDKDRTHLRDMIDVGLIDETWVKGLPSELGERLQSLIDNPEG